MRRIARETADPAYNSGRMDSFIIDHLKGVSRTYAIVIPMLPRGLDEAVGLAYLLMRIVDTLEDAPQLDDATRRGRLAELGTAIDGRDDGLPELAQPLGDLAAERALMIQVAEVLARVRRLDLIYRDAAFDCARKMIAGVLSMLERSTQRGVPYPGNRNSVELREYCYYVAGVVGEMLCGMMAHFL